MQIIIYVKEKSHVGIQCNLQKKYFFELASRKIKQIVKYYSNHRAWLPSSCNGLWIATFQQSMFHAL